MACLTAGLTQLLPLERVAVMRHRLQGVSVADLAREMMLSPASVAGLLRRGLNRLRKLLGDQG